MKMRLCKIYAKKLLFITILIFCCLQKPAAQQTASYSDDHQGLFFGLSYGLSQSKITFEGAPATLNLTTTMKPASLGSLELGYTFSKYFGLSSGLGFISYRNQLKLANYQNEFTTIDSENEQYDMTVTGTDITEEQKIDLLTIPFCIHLRLPLSESMGLFVKSGINISIPINKKYTSSGTFSYKGYYSKYNVTFENLPDIGFPSDKSISNTSDLKLNALYFTPTVSGGLYFNLEPNIQINLAANYNATVLKEAPSSVMANSPTNQFKLSPDIDHVNSLMGISNKVNASSIGIEFTLRFYF